MNTEDLGNSKILNLLFKPAGMLMGSMARRWLMSPMKTLQGAGIQPGQTVLEVGCGTGFFTIPAAQLIGDEGCLVAMDALSGFINQVAKKVQSADLKNVRVVKRDALNTGIGCRKHRQGVVVWCDSLPFVALESSFARNAPRNKTRREVGSVVVSGFWLGTKVDHSIRVIHICQQTKRSLQLQALLIKF